MAVLPEPSIVPPAEEHVDGTRLADLVQKLPMDQREAVWLSKVEGMTAVEIGRVVGATAGAVKLRVHRATEKLREWFGAEDTREPEEQR